MSTQTTLGSGWFEQYAGGSPEAERAEFEQLATGIMEAQAKAQKKASRHGVPHAAARTLHAKSTLAVDDAELRFLDDLPEDLQHGFAQPGASYRTVVRFSNASGVPQADHEKDLRGVALRVVVDEDVAHDLLMTNFPVSHARDARHFVEFARATAGGAVSQLLGVLALVRRFGLRETLHMFKNVLDGAPQPARQRGHGDVLEPRRPDLGTHDRGALPAAARTGQSPDDTLEDRPGLPVHGGGHPTPQPRRAHGAVRAAFPRRAVHADRGHQHRVDRAGLATRAGRGPHHQPTRRHHTPRRSTPPARSRPSPSTPGTRRTPSGRSATSTGRARRSTTPARPSAAAPAGTPRSRSATWCSAPPPGRGSRP